MGIEIQIDEDTCACCGECLSVCSGSVLQLQQDKIVVQEVDLCSEIRSCMPNCPQGAIKIEGKREVKLAKNYCDGSEGETSCELNFSELYNWPVKMRAIRVDAPFLEDAHILLAADCTAFAHGRFHQEFLMDKVLMTTCPKYLSVEEYQHLEAIITNNTILAIDVVEMDVNCCSTLFVQVQQLLLHHNQNIPVNHYMLTTDGMVEQ
ncbi:MAG: hypothetical protein ACRCZJ_02905 [Erysipelotrichaceae bacterium]